MNLPAFIPYLLIAAVMFVLIRGVFGKRKRTKRRDLLGQWANSLNLDFREGQDPTFDGRFTFRALRHGKNRYAYNAAQGDFEGRQIWAFDYHYETQSQRTITTKDARGNTQMRTQTETHHHHFSAVIVAANIPLQRLLIRPEGWFDMLKSFFGKNDLDFESAQFSRRYHVSADDRKWAYDVLHARAIEALLDRPPCTLEFDDGHHVLVLNGSKTLTPEGFDESLRTADTLLDLLPEYLRQQQQNLPPTPPEQSP